VIADDDPVVQLLLSMSLGSKFEVVGIAADGEEAIDLVRRKQPDVALVDVVMPRGGGARAVRGIVEVAPGTAIVMLSGHNASAAVSRLLQAGAVVYRRKGVQADVLAEALAQSIETHTAERRESAWRILSCYRVALDHRSGGKRASASCR
jgi:DNA-binding NarL/FixJ family response regulator